MKRENYRSNMKQLKDRMTQSKDQFYRNRRQKGFMAFWWLDPLHYVLVLEVAIADASSKSINFEAIVKLLPGSMGSRSTVATVLEDFVALGYMIKQVGEDKRKRVYRMSDDAMRLLNDWYMQTNFSLKAVG